MKITYKDIKLEFVEKEKINEVLELVKNKKFTKMNFNYPFDIQKAFNSYQVKKRDNAVEVIYWSNKGLKRIVWSANKAYPETAGNEGLSGQAAYEYVNEQYKNSKKTNKKTSLFSDISGEKYSAEYRDIKKCIPSAINYCLDRCRDKITNHVYKADVSSAYPDACCGSIPTLHGFKRVKGRVEPTEEYPFAFYIKSHHLAIYKELNTRKFKSMFYPQYYNQANTTSWTPNDKIKAEDDETILCRDSGISLKEIFQNLYDGRKERVEFKFIMNAFIGRCQLNSNPIMSHLSAVVLARVVNNMLKRCETLRKEGSFPIFISTDSIAWKGNPSACATFDKYLGSFTYEAYDSQFFLRGLKAYQYYNLEGKVAGVCGHIAKNDPRRTLFGQIPEVQTINNELVFITENGTIKTIF